jgi:cell wall-associated NlpC family hydrolase
MSVFGQKIADLALTQVDPKKEKNVYLKAGQGGKVTAGWLASYRARYGLAPYVGAEADIGKRAFDCSGLVTYCLKSLGLNMDYATHNPRQYQASEVKIDKAQIQPGDLCFRCTLGVATHIGICVGDNQVVEAKGRAYGVVKTTGATSWSCFRRVRKVAADMEVQPPKPVLTRDLYFKEPYMKGDDVAAMQRQLIAKGYRGKMSDSGIGEFGPNTDAAMRKFQTEYMRATSGVGICGQKTWAALFN